MKRMIRSSSQYDKQPWKDPELEYVSNVNGYQVYRKIENGKGKWFAHYQNDPIETMFPITYDQARGFEDMPARSSTEKLGRDLGKMLLPVNSSSQIPAPFNQYYEIVSDKWLERNTGYDVEEFGYPCEDAPGYDIKHLAWAYAKDIYQNELLDNGMEAVELVQEGEGEPFLATLVNDRVIPVSTVDMPEAWE